MFKKTLICFIVLTLLLVCLLPVIAAQWDLTDGEEVIIFTNTNIAVVHNNTKYYPTFTITSTCKISQITTYHRNNGEGSYPGTISLKDSNGNIYGPWKATTRSGQDNVPNAYWDVFPYITLAPGTYTIIDSEPSTWSCNEDTGYKGMSWVYGTAVTSSNGDSEKWMEVLFSGKTFTGNCLSDSGKQWPFKIKFTYLNKSSGTFQGEIEWTSLNSIHKIEGTISGEKISFKETEYIKQGNAYLNAVYDLQHDSGSNSVKGTWYDPVHTNYYGTSNNSFSFSL